MQGEGNEKKKKRCYSTYTMIQSLAGSLHEKTSLSKQTKYFSVYDRIDSGININDFQTFEFFTLENNIEITRIEHVAVQ